MEVFKRLRNFMYVYIFFIVTWETTSRYPYVIRADCTPCICMYVYLYVCIACNCRGESFSR